MRKIIYVVVVSVVLTIAFSGVMFYLENDKQMRKQNMDRRYMLLSSLMSRDFETAKRYFDTLRPLSDNDQFFYYEEGWMYDMLNDKERSRRCFLKSLRVLDEQLDTMSVGMMRDNAMMIRFLLIQALYGGEKVYQKAKDSLAKKMYDPSSLDGDIRDFEYRKEKMFHGVVLKTKMGWSTWNLDTSTAITPELINSLKRQQMYDDSVFGERLRQRGRR